MIDFHIILAFFLFPIKLFGKVFKIFQTIFAPYRTKAPWGTIKYDRGFLVSYPVGLQQWFTEFLEGNKYRYLFYRHGHDIIIAFFTSNDLQRFHEVQHMMLTSYYDNTNGVLETWCKENDIPYHNDEHFVFLSKEGLMMAKLSFQFSKDEPYSLRTKINNI